MRISEVRPHHVMAELGLTSRGPRGSAATGRWGCRGGRLAGHSHQENIPREEVGGSPTSARGSCVQGARHSTTVPVTTCRVRKVHLVRPTCRLWPQRHGGNRTGAWLALTGGRGGTERRAHDRTGGLTPLCQGIQMVPQLEGATPRPQNAGTLCGCLPPLLQVSPRYRLLGGHCHPPTSRILQL